MKNKGITLLLAILISTMALAVGLGIFTVIYGEVGIATTSKESLEAFFAADSGIECALYLDIQQDAFATLGPKDACAGNNINITDPIVNTFNLTFPSPSSPKSCTTVRVDKTDPLQTVVTSLGQNTPCPVINAKTVQRGLEVRY